MLERYLCFNAGRNTFMGYYKNEKETKEALDGRGFVHSGDIGQVGPNGVLSITGRIKELIITAGG
jgi:long-subunit acyl-CoA synthetase (AMP-forming)